MLLFSCQNTEHKSDSTEEINYILAADWPQFPDGFVLGSPVGMAMDSEEHLYVFHRADRSVSKPHNKTFITTETILKIDRNTGEIMDCWGANMFERPHGLHIDAEDNIWLTDVVLHQVFKTNASGEILMTLGEAYTAGNDSLHFDQPTDVAVAEDGTVYISDGYGNSRVVKFTSAGKYITEWGTFGGEPGQFNTPHAIEIDQYGQIYVADRENSRFQKFTSEGIFIESIGNENDGTVYTVRYDKWRRHLLATDFLAENDTNIAGSDLIVYAPDGKKVRRFGKSGMYRGPKTRYHDIAIDRDGNIYAGDIFGNRLQKFELVDE